MSSLESPLRDAIKEHKPDGMVSDMLYPWTARLAAEFDIPTLGFNGTGCFASRLMGIILMINLMPEGERDEDSTADPAIVVPGTAHKIEIEKAKLRGIVTLPGVVLQRMAEAYGGIHGTVMNTFHGLESEYIDHEPPMQKKTWLVGPLSLYNRDSFNDMAVRGGASDESFGDCLKWLDTKLPGSALYICFGSLGQFTSPQLREIARGLELSSHPFVWVIKGGSNESEWMPAGFEEEVGGGNYERASS